MRGVYFNWDKEAFPDKNFSNQNELGFIAQEVEQVLPEVVQTEKTAEGWKIYDLNVENIWLIENYRNQFTQEISKSGIDGLIAALNKRAQ